MFRFISVLVVGLAITSGAMAAPAKLIAPRAEVLGATPIYLEIKDWVLACDNTRACVARFASADVDVNTGDGYLAMERKAGPQGKLVISIEDYEGGKRPDPRSLRIDGRQTMAGLTWRLDSSEQTATLDGDAALKLLRSLVEGRKLTYSRGGMTSTVTLSGMKAVLLAMDEDQGRLNTVSALVRVGAKPANSALPAVPLPVIHAAPQPPPLPDRARFAALARRAHAALLRQYDCEPEMAHEDQAFALDASTVLVMLGCNQAAYQESILAFEAPRGAPEKAQLLVLPVPPTEPAEQDDPGDYVSLDWDAKTSTLHESAKGRGLADCGESTSWTFDGKRFVLSGHNVMGRCGGGPPGERAAGSRSRLLDTP